MLGSIIGKKKGRESEKERRKAARIFELARKYGHAHQFSNAIADSVSHCWNREYERFKNCSNRFKTPETKRRDEFFNSSAIVEKYT